MPGWSASVLWIGADWAGSSAGFDPLEVRLDRSRAAASTRISFAGL